MTSSVTSSASASQLHVVFVCTGNICRSPMGDVILQSKIEDAGLEDQVRVSSCGLGGWHVGEGADRRAVEELRFAGYDGSRHRAAQVSTADKAADLVIAMDQGHQRELLRSGFEPQKVRLLKSFDPNAVGQDVEDPYYGPPEGFRQVRKEIEAAMPELLAWIEQRLQEA
ncbi:low molecular weight phosphotyrosine protein phosphatase [Corynebacterium sp. 35RC1]|nr:low molecular weight phosphotyrosine protein phosphatase [Corynebacterium sp. 35RC1]